MVGAVSRGAHLSGDITDEALSRIQQQLIAKWFNDPAEVFETVEIILQSLGCRKAQRAGWDTPIDNQTWWTISHPGNGMVWHGMVRVDCHKSGRMPIWLGCTRKKTVVCGNYRGISILSVAAMVLPKILLTRLSRLVEDHPPGSLCGLKTGMSTIDMILALWQLQKTSPLYMVFIDFT